MENSVNDLVIRIKNGYLARREKIEIIKAVFNANVLKKLLDLGFIQAYDIKDRVITVTLLYKDHQPAVTDIKIFSKPGRRYYVSYKSLKPILGGLGYAILSTPKGILTNSEARKEQVGGELLFNIW